MTSTAVVPQRFSAIRKKVEKIAYYTYTGMERAGGRQRYFRNLKSHEWTKLYGSNFAYSSDYIQANPKAHGKLVGNMARTANRTEELGEIAFRFTGGYCRLAGAIALRSLREMTGAPRFAKRLRRLMAQQNLQSAHVNLEDLAYKVAFQLRSLGVLNYKGFLSPILTDEKIVEALVGVGIYPNATEALADVVQWRKMLRAADVMRRPAPMTFKGRCAMAVGCTLSSVVFALAYSAISSASSALAVTFFAKMGMVGAGLYFSAFLMRTATFAVANCTRSFKSNPHPEGQRIRNYDGLFELAGQHLIRIRNRLYYKMGIEPKDGYVHSSGLSQDRLTYLDSLSFREGQLMAQDEEVNIVARRLFTLSNVLHRATDVMFSMDRIIGLGLVSTPVKHFVFDYHEDMKHRQMLDANGKCNITRRYTASRSHSMLARARRATAFLVGHGGADCLGMTVGCGVCSAAWTAMNIPMGGYMFSVPLADGAVAGVGLGFASAGALGWGASSTADATARAVDWSYNAIRAKLA